MQPPLWIRVALLSVLIVGLGVPPDALVARAQQGPQKPTPQQPVPPTPPSGQQQQQKAPTPPPPQSEISTQTNVVTLDAVVTDQDGDIVTDLKQGNFRVLDNGQPQQITNFSPTDAPITIVILMEFSRALSSWGYFGYKAKGWAYDFLNHLGPKDWVAFKTFDLKTHLVDDFTRNKNQVAQDIASLYFPDFSEANLFDAVLETLDQLRDVRGRKAILLLATGVDTFSHHTLDQTYKILKESDTTIFCVGMGEEIDLYSGSGGTPIGYLQAKNELTQFANMTGGYAWFPRFEGEAPSIFNSVAAFLRAQYTIGFTPSTPPDGRYHKLKVEIVDDQGNPLQVENHKGKKKKVIVYARQGYMAPTAAAAGN